MRKLIVLIGLHELDICRFCQQFEYIEKIKLYTDDPSFPDKTDVYKVLKKFTSLTSFVIYEKIGGYHFGVKRDDLERINGIALAIFPMAFLGKIPNLNDIYKKIEIITIGISTQSEGGGNNIINCDIILKGNEVVIENALQTVVSILESGGVLSSEQIGCLIKASSLLTNAACNQIKTASYDLLLADKYWCQGEYYTLTEDKPTGVIPPYSFVLVQAKEEAEMPRFIVGTFDLRVSLFFSGVILSNGPQVDPGYRGSLFCMLYNASGIPVGLNRGTHFATIQFQSMSRNTVGYDDHYQNKKKFEEFLEGTVAKGPGGKIFESVKQVEQKIKEEMGGFQKEIKSEIKSFQSMFWSMVAVVLVPAFVAIGWAYTMADKASTAADKANDSINKASIMVKEFEVSTNKINSRIEKIEENQPENKKQKSTKSR